MRASFTAAWDRDNTRLRYDLMRGAAYESAVVAASTTADTTFWTRPALTLTDPGAPPGTSQTYRIRAVDPYANTMVGQTAVINVPAGPGQTAYQARVAQDGAVDQWTLGEAERRHRLRPARRPGPDPARRGPAQPAQRAGRADRPVHRLPGQRQRDDRRDGRPGPQTFSVEAWFRAVPGTRGKIIGFGNAAPGPAPPTTGTCT